MVYFYIITFGKKEKYIAVGSNKTKLEEYRKSSMKDKGATEVSSIRERDVVIRRLHG